MLSAKQNGGGFMSGDNIVDGATLSTVVGTLDDPVEYVRQVLSNMMAAKRKYGGACVRIGLTGRGIAPHYRVEPSADWLTSVVLEGKDPAPYYVAYHGRSHKQLAWGTNELRVGSWSHGMMDVTETQNLLLGIRTASKVGGA